MKKIFNCSYLLLSIILLFSCVSTTTMIPEEESKDEAKDTGIVNEFFDPLILEDEELNIRKTVSIESKSDKVEETITQSISEDQKPEVTTGFRVQICAVLDEDRAKQIQRDAILKFIDEDVYLIYDSPYYKVRVGNCPTRFEADKLQQLAVEKGFEDAWVVRTNITLKIKNN